jgi:predicted outer membrane protein
MKTLRTHAGKKEVIIAAVVIYTFAGCGTSSNEAPVANPNVAAAPEPAQRSTRQAPAGSSQAYASSAPAAPDEGNTRRVLSQIHEANLMEIALGKMAEEKASTSEVRAYDQLVQDHTNVDQMVVAMIQKSRGHLKNGAAAGREGRHEIAQVKQLERKLKAVSGPDFDRLFLQQTSSDHERLIRKLQQDREDASDDNLRL